MVKRLAIKGHPTRGNEVIELLEMFGGVKPFSDNRIILGNKENNCYYIFETAVTKYISWDYIGPDEIDKYKIFTLEEFLEKYPFKVGDKVYIKIDPNDDCLGSEKIYGEIESAVWVEKYGHVVYKLKDCSSIFYREELHPCEEEVSMEDNKLPSKYYEETQSKRDMEKTMFMLGHTLVQNKVDDKLEYEITNGYEFDKVENNKIILKPIKSKYPKTYEECCDILNIETNRIIDYDDCLGYRDITQYDTKLLTQLRCLRKIRICRDAYWKIAGEEMGLGKPWEPDLENEELYCIQNYNKQITISRTNTAFNKILIFPTEEMRDVFYKNFKVFIKLCKEWL